MSVYLGFTLNMYRVGQKKGTVLLSTFLAWLAVAGCSRAETFSQLSSISFAQPCKACLPDVALEGEEGASSSPTV